MRLVTPVLPTALSKSSRIRLTPNSWMVCRFPAFASGNSCFISSPVQKLKNSAKQNSWRVCRFSPWNLARCFRIWLGAFGKAGFFRCQSAPVPLSLFCATALCKSSRIRLTPNSWMVCRFPSWSVFSSLEAGGLCPALACGF